jgi:uncharacterized protein YdeI (YjbR/CyaY-like superfamily)
MKQVSDRENLLVFKDRDSWKRWLERHGSEAKGAWIVSYRKISGKTCLTYEDALAEAICHGWIDGKIKKIDDLQFARRFTPRNPKSHWSKINIARARKLIREGRMTAAGMAAFRPDRVLEIRPTEFPAPLEQVFRKNKRAWTNYQSSPPSYRRLTALWVASAKKEDTQRKRLDQLIATSQKGDRIKFMYKSRRIRNFL